ARGPGGAASGGARRGPGGGVVGRRLDRVRRSRRDRGDASRRPDPGHGGHGWRRAGGAPGGRPGRCGPDRGHAARCPARRAPRRAQRPAAGAGAVVPPDEADLVAAGRQHTEGVGADVVLDLVRGPGQADLATATRPGGTLLAAGFLDPRPAPPVDGPVTVHDYRGFAHTTDPAVVRRMAAFLGAGVRLGVIRPAVGPVLGLDDVVAAHRLAEEGAGAGKV